MIVPIIIYRDKKSKEEIRRELEWEESIRKAEEELRYREQQERERIKNEKRRIKEEKENALNDAYHKAKLENPWDFEFLPEGWDLLGQRYIYPIDWDGRKDEFESLI